MRTARTLLLGAMLSALAALLPASAAIIVVESIDETPDPPQLTSIPDVPFDYLMAAGTPTQSGTLPTTLAAGEVLTLTTTNLPSDYTITCSGTAENPAFILGGLVSGLNNILNVQGSYCYFVGTEVDNMQVRTAGNNHVFRDIEVHSVSGKNGSSFGGTQIVLYSSEIHHNQGDDRHGIHVPSGADSIWILENWVHHNGGDGFQACHGCSANPPQNVYIGNNLFHSDRENAIDFKYLNNVIVEGNTIHSLVSAPADTEWCFDDMSSCGVFSSGSDGSAIVIGSDGGPTGVVIVNNEIYSTVHGVRIEETYVIPSTTTGAQILDNNIHDISGNCLQLDKNGAYTVYSGNTCDTAARGIFQNWRQNFSLDVDDNTFIDVTGASVEYESSAVWLGSTLTNNTFTNSGPVIHGNNTYTTQSEINGSTGASGNIVN